MREVTKLSLVLPRRVNKVKPSRLAKYSNDEKSTLNGRVYITKAEKVLLRNFT